MTCASSTSQSTTHTSEFERASWRDHGSRAASGRAWRLWAARRARAARRVRWGAPGTGAGARAAAAAAAAAASTGRRHHCPLALQATGWHDGGFVGFRRGYLQGLPEDRFAPLHMHENTDVGPIIAVCEAFWVQEVLIEITDTVLCAVLVVYTVYIGYSHTQAVINGDGLLSRGVPSKGGRPGVRV